MTIWQTIKKHPTSLVWAIVIHLLVFIAIGISFKSSSPRISTANQQKVIEAVAIDESKINAEIKKLKKAETKKINEQKQLQDKAKNAKLARQKEEQSLQALKKEHQKQERLNEKERLAAENRIAELKKNREAQERQQKETEQKQQSALKKLNELEKKKKEKEAQLEREEKERLEKIAQKKRDEEHAKREQLEKNEVAKYKVLIDEKVSRNWIYLDSYKKGLLCVIQIKLLPSGDVVGATIIQSSGDSAFDRSAELAANKASPLPVPTNDTDLFQREFRTVNLTFKPNY
jgi:colicin import membrane protein